MFLLHLPIIDSKTSLINESGKLVKVIRPNTSPLDEEIQNWIKK